MQVTFDADDLRPAIELAERETLEKLAEVTDLFPPQRIAFPEAEAASLLGIPRHCLGNARRRGEIQGSLVGNKYLYSRDEILEFLERCRDGERIE